ncbi:MAG: nucleotidyltransferase family protein [Clostridiaceae bacterium]|nr:nucleotidyltransferase family protein [Clostridiaceae bacterium]MBW4860879.1 nucleotidyltransferase family protein [Clostridiaceae bacterium]MBW4867504.1 nucleotidyltransferase family protein [Clostridiaceae bacterium]
MNIEGIILAGGLSTRARTNKLLLNIGGKTLIERCILGMYDVCSKIIVVGGHRVEEISDILSLYNKVELIYNNNYLDGMFSSVIKGISNISGEKFFLIPGDYPAIKKRTYEEMLKLDEDIIIPVYNGRRGHPLLMKSYLIDELLENPCYNTLRDFIDEKGFNSVSVNDPGILMDIDTIEDYQKILSYLNLK